MDAVTVGLDIGTTSTKAVAVDGRGRVLQRVRLPHQVLVPAADRLEHDADRAWRRGPRRALAALGSVDVRAIGVAAMVPSLTAVDRRGRPLTPGLLYGDARGRIDPFGDRAVGDPVGHRAADGGPPAPAPGSSGAEVAGFLRWTARAAPEAAGFWPAQAVALKALGGQPAVDMAVAYTADPLFGPSGWDADLCAGCGVRADQLPTVELPGSPVGWLGGDRDGPLLAPGTVDVWCEQLVAGADEIGDVHVICGTSLIVWAVIPAGSGADGTDGEGDEPSGLWSVPAADADRRLVGGASNAGGLFLEWADRLLRPRPRAGPQPELDPASVPVWAPYVRGERTPYQDPGRRAELHGLDLTHGPGELQRAAWEASAFVVRHLLELGRVPARRIVATGGGTRMPGWIQALADCTSLPIHVAAEPEGAARGAAFLARLAAGLDTDLRQAAGWAATGHIVEPRSGWLAPAEDRYARFLELSDAK